MKFCFLCGKKTENLIKGYCEECYNKEFKLIESPKEISLTVCSKCNRIKHKNKWKDSEIDELLKDKIKILGKNVGIRIEKNDVLHIFAKGYLNYSKKLKEEKHDIILKLNKIVCSDCSKRFGDYYEAILQLRGEVSEIMDFIDDQVIKEKKIYRLERVKNGFNLYLVDKHFANTLSNVLKKRFNVKVKKTFKLITRREGKDIYRSVILVRI